MKKLLRQTSSSQYEDPTSSFGYMKGISDKDVKKVGTETDGTATTHYKVSVDVTQLAKDNAQQAKQLRAQLNGCRSTCGSTGRAGSARRRSRSGPGPASRATAAHGPPSPPR
ncbi:hypothetical protein SRIMM317S_03167 [Streptomyces rimosus subsp. rimosus]